MASLSQLLTDKIRNRSKKKQPTANELYSLYSRASLPSHRDPHHGKTARQIENEMRTNRASIEQYIYHDKEL